jgi:hypothetical protein
LYLQAKTYGKRPSKLLKLKTEWGAWQLDETVMIIGRQIEIGLEKGKKIDELLNAPTAPGKPGQYSSGLGRVKKKVKVRKDGTW